MSNGSGPHDHPGEYKLVDVSDTRAEVDIHADLDAAEVQEFKLVTANNRWAFLYKEQEQEKKKDKKH